ncbi:MAG: HAMP domain-containing histidine kinase [Lachnospiraceae bacterium]|nr:HAMP domain-containing histidine kinase [Lachnospiraceae bacterium]
MIKKLQIKFVVINMTIVTIMLSVIFGLIYNFTQRHLETESINMMRSIASNPFQPGHPDDSTSDLRLPFFILQLSPEGELVSSDGGYYDLSNRGFLIDLINESVKNRQEIGLIKEHNLRYCRISMPMGTVIVFSDISSETNTLNSLLKSFAVIGLFSFLVFLGISIFLSRWAVKPVARAWQQQKQFVADASHELKTPLTVIMTNTELLQCPDYNEMEKNNFLQSILLMSGQMKQLVEKILILAKSDNQMTTLPMSPINLSKLTLNSTISFEGIFYEKGLSFESFVEPDIIVHGNEDGLQQVIDILLDNAQKYSLANSETHVTLYSKERNKCCLKVSNQGNPIPQAELKHIFQRFYRMDKARSRGSFGLGLSIAENIVAQHQGRIWAESKDGVNSFFVQLNIKK